MENNTFVDDRELFEIIHNCIIYLVFAPDEINLKYKERIKDMPRNLHPTNNFSRNEWINLENELKNEVGPYMERIKNMFKPNKRAEKKFQKMREAEEQFKKELKNFGLL